MAASGGPWGNQVSGTTADPVSGGKYWSTITNVTGRVTGLKILSVMPSA